MILKLVYRKQKYPHSCGPAVLEMMLHAAGTRVSHERLIRDTKATPTYGTSRADMIRVLRQYGLHTHTHINSSLAEITFFLQHHIPVAVNYRDLVENQGHFAVVVGIKNNVVYLHDPDYQAHYKIPAKVFMRRWHGRHLTTNRKWILTASNSPLPSFHH
ncbi:MAG: C39 family peptidase [Candidatus Andersenbacteria bacterium]|nr:C39 family peptidase [Candidatus Andersenbacteria bacterium]MBI3250637.1 C39 family peptidase [Candidatus Andersenbacteria bacterium]